MLLPHLLWWLRVSAHPLPDIWVLVSCGWFVCVCVGCDGYRRQSLYFADNVHKWLKCRWFILSLVPFRDACLVLWSSFGPSVWASAPLFVMVMVHGHEEWIALCWRLGIAAHVMLFFFFFLFVFFRCHVRNRWWSSSTASSSSSAVWRLSLCLLSIYCCQQLAGMHSALHSQWMLLARLAHNAVHSYAVLHLRANG